MGPVCAVSVDLDPLGCYYGIHGLGAAPAELSDVVLRRGLPRFLELFARRRLAATFFVVGEDLDEGVGTAAGREALRAAVAAGHELGNHTHHHRYELTRLDPEAIGREIDGAHQRIAEVAGAPPVGFRAPGYNINAALMSAVAARGYRYDSSLLPAPAYYGAKAAVMAAMGLAGRRSQSVLGDPRQLWSSRLPYRPDEQSPWRRGHARLVELPITVTPSLRLPVIGTPVVTAPALVRRLLLGAVRGLPFFNFELHGIDLCDAAEDGLPDALKARRPELKVPLARRLQALEDTLDRLADAFRFAPLREVAEEFQEA